MMSKRAFLIFTFLVLISRLAFCQEGQFSYDSQNKRDPFLSLVSPEGYIVNFDIEIDSSDLKVEGIIYDPYAESLAIVNGKIVKIGDYIGEFKVEKIDKDKVIFLNNNEEMVEIKFKKEE